jgi:hypothetical protein
LNSDEIMSEWGTSIKWLDRRTAGGSQSPAHHNARRTYDRQAVKRRVSEAHEQRRAAFRRSGSVGDDELRTREIRGEQVRAVLGAEFDRRLCGRDAACSLDAITPCLSAAASCRSADPSSRPKVTAVRGWLGSQATKVATYVPVPETTNKHPRVGRVWRHREERGQEVLSQSVARSPCGIGDIGRSGDEGAV